MEKFISIIARFTVVVIGGIIMRLVYVSNGGSTVNTFEKCMKIETSNGTVWIKNNADIACVK